MLINTRKQVTAISFAAATLAYAIFHSIVLPAQTQVSRNNSNFHIWMTIQEHSGNPIADLRSKDFSIGQGAHKYPLTVEQPATAGSAASHSPVPTRLLVMFDPKLAYDKDALQSAFGALGPVWKRGWVVGFWTPNGMTTPYMATESEASRIVKAGMSQTTEKHLSLSQVVSTLGDGPGRRVLLYVSTPNGWMNTKMPLAIAKEADKVMAQVYIVDGGRPAGASTFQGEEVIPPRSSDPASPPARISETGQYVDVSYPAENLFKFGRFQEISLKDAVRNSMKDADGFYDIAIDCRAAACPNVQQPLSIHINHVGPLRVTAMGVGAAENLNFDITTR